MKKYGFIFLVAALALACEEKKKKDVSDVEDLRRKKIQKHVFNKYTEGELLVVMDTSQWQRTTGRLIRKAFGEGLYGLPRPEPDYKITRVGGNDFKGILKDFRNILIVVNLSSDSPSDKYLKGLLGKKNLDKISEKGYLLQNNIYFPGQNVIYIAAADQKTLNELLSQHSLTFKTFYDRNVQEYLFARLTMAQNSDAIFKRLKEDFGLQAVVPAEYKIAKTRENFLWIRSEGIEEDKSMLFSVRPYTSQQQFDDSSLQAWRDSLGHFLKPPEDSIFVLTQEYMPLLCNVELPQQAYTKKCRGLWKLSDNSLGGPFISKVFLSKDQTRIYYIEGFLMAPGKSKRKSIRELNALISNIE